MTLAAVTKNIKNMYSSCDFELFFRSEKEINLLFRAKE